MTFAAAAVLAWKERGLEIAPETIEAPGVYSPTLMLGDRDPEREIERVKRALEAAGFRKLAKRQRDRLGALPALLAIPGTASTAQVRGDEIVVAHARRAGLPAGGRLPCRLALVLQTTALLGPWARRGLEGCGAVRSAADEQLVLEPGGDAVGGFDAVTAALVSSGARVATSESECRARFVEHMRQQIRRAGLDPDTIDLRPHLQGAPRETILHDRDGSMLNVSSSPGTVSIVRTCEADS